MGHLKKTSTILVVDDETEVADAIKGYLTSFTEATIQVAYDADTAYNFATKQIREKKKLDLILTDYRMGRTSGLDFLKKIRKNDFLKHTPVLMISAHLQEEIIKEAVALKDISFIVKPFDEKTLQKKIESLLDETESKKSSA